MNSYHAFWNDRSGVGIRNSSLDPTTEESVSFNDKSKTMPKIKRRSSSSKQEFLIQTINELTEELREERHQKDKLRKRLSITRSKLRTSMLTDDIDTISMASSEFQTMEQRLSDLQIENQKFKKRLHDNKRSQRYSQVMVENKKAMKQELDASKKQIADLVQEIERLREEIHKDKAVKAMKRNSNNQNSTFKSIKPAKSIKNINEFLNEIESMDVIRISSIQMASEPSVSIVSQIDKTRRSNTKIPSMKVPDKGQKIIVQHAREQAQIKKLKKRNSELKLKLDKMERSSITNNRNEATALTKLSKGELIVQLIDTKRRKEAIHDKIAKIRIDAKKKNTALQKKYDELEQKYKDLESSASIMAVTQTTNEKLREKLARKNINAATLRSRHQSLINDSNIVLLNMVRCIEKASEESKAGAISLIAKLKSTSKELSIKEANNYTKYWRNLITRLHHDAHKLIALNKRDVKTNDISIDDSLD